MTKENLRILMGENIRRERTARNMSIDELSGIIGLTSGFVGLIERGKRGATAHTIYMVSQTFEISVDNIFAGTSDRRNEPQAESGGNRRNKIASLLHGLADNELDFIIQTIKGIKVMNHTRYTEVKDDAVDSDENENEDEEYY